MAWKAKLARLGLMALITWACMELVTCVAGRALSSRGLFYEARGSTDLAAYLRERDPLLGWPKRSDLLRPGYDAIHSRVVPASPDPHAPPCVSIYGDSFAWAEEVDAEHAWGNVLAQRAGCRVHNFGVGGYGPDQAYLRFGQLRDVDKSKVVILTHLSENVLRNLNRLRNLIAPTGGLGLKPRFVVDDAGALQLLPMITPSSEEDARDIVEHPERRITDDPFVPGGPAGVTRLSFPYVLSVARVLRGYKMRAALAGEPPHAAFYDPAHPARGLAVSAAILKAFHRDALARGASPFVVFIPLPADFAYQKKHGRWPYAPLVEEMAKAGVPYLDSADRLLDRLGGKDPCSLYKRCSGGHFNEEGYRALGEIVHDFLRERGALPR